ncbi:MBL fold metallo-hydrolase [Streptomyces sp. JV176]|uniref:MBL fold metallo-hydrolase n=1 Tax=Streptomyces sp. JV176 TaxID=858630 RepID=UPI002E779F15|nr:MBL fold metallo-hydrolase [Streptomyces sp. JV176]MEE1802654.1 MBL fold metallo-hydrolase [Streptomyces sp. JV176]
MDVRWEEHGWERLAPGVGRVRLPGWDATVGLVVGERGALLYDTGSTLREGAELRARTRALLGGRRVTHVALSHPHFDHVLGAAAFSGVAVYGAVGLAELLAGDGAGKGGSLYEEAVREGVAEAEAAEAVDLLVSPGHAVSGELTLDLGGGRRVVLANVGPGHTAHDLALLVPGTGAGTGGGAGTRGAPAVLFCGDLVEESGEPQAGPDAVPARWPAALDRLLALGGGDGTVYVPGHGAVVDAAFVRAQRDALAARFGGSGAPS